MRGDHSQETPAVVIQLRKFSCFFFWLLMGGVTNDSWTGTKWRLDSISTVYYMYHWWSVPDSVTVVVSEIDHDARKMMSLLCTAQTVWNKGLKKHWFPIVATYGMCIMGTWTCLWSGTCNIIIILHHKVTNDLISADLEIIPGGGG